MAMEDQQKNTPMTDNELDQLLQDLSHQIEEPTKDASADENPEKAPTKKKNKKVKKKQKTKPDSTPKKTKTTSRRTLNMLWLLLTLIFGAVFIISATYIIRYKSESEQRQEEDESRANVVASIQAAVQATKPSEKPATPAPVPTYPGGLPINPPTEPTVQEILPEYKPFFDQNPELVGWIKIPDTKINYPVVQSMPDNKNYYIDHDFLGRARGAGAIYVRESCDVFMPSDNVTIYGHHMKDGSMFAGLDKFIDKSFWETHQTFTFDTIFEHHTYQVIAIFVTTANVGEGFSFHQFENAATENEFNVFIESVKNLDLYDTGVTAEYGDKLVCLSTCAQGNDRLVVVAKRIS